MTINRDTWHYRMFEWYFNQLHRYHRHRRFGTDYTDYWTFDDISQGRVSLCQYFWIVMLFAPLKKLGKFMERNAERLAVGFGITMSVVVTAIIIINAGLMFYLQLIGLILAAGVAALGVLYLVFKLEDVDFKPSQTLPVQYIKARKQRVCPILKFEDVK